MSTLEAHQILPASHRGPVAPLTARQHRALDQLARWVELGAPVVNVADLDAPAATRGALFRRGYVELDTTADGSPVVALTRAGAVAVGRLRTVPTDAERAAAIADAERFANSYHPPVA